jgi:hypothetical protein
VVRILFDWPGLRLTQVRVLARDYSSSVITRAVSLDKN